MPPQASGKAKKEYLKRKKVQRRERREQDARDSEEEKNERRAAKGDGGGGGARRPPRSARARGANSGGGLAPPSSEPLHYVPLVEVAGGARLPVLDLAEVGWDGGRGQDGAAAAAAPPPPLPMPTRPDWRAAGVTTAEELHALEEREFERWAERLRELAIDADRKAGGLSTPPPEETPLPAPLTGLGTPRAGGPGWGAPSLSFFEGRLDFWRQLWRTLEMSDALLVLADSRNPLLHWPTALHARAVEKGLPVVLVLSKADLVPQASIVAWRSFFERAYPGLKVVAVAAGGSGASAVATQGDGATTAGRAAARELVSAVLDLEVERGGKKTTVGAFVGMGADDVLDHSAARNRHARREVSSRAAAALAAAGGGGGKGRGKGAGVEDGEEDEEEEEDWCVRGTKARKQLAKKQQRQQRGQRKAAPPPKQQQQKQKKQQHGSSEDEIDESSDGGSISGSSGTESGSDNSSSDGERWSEDDDDDSADDGASATDADDDPDLARRLKSLTLEGQLLGGGDQRPPPKQQQHEKPSSASSPPCSPIRHRDDNPDHHHNNRPVVVGLVGEPNVGKSSALNALLGAHRVAVSAHPGRTRTYQTHWMAPRLVLCDCPGLVFPRRGVAVAQQVLFGSFPIAQCRDPYGVVRYLAERLWPRAESALRLAPLRQEDDDEAGVLGGAGGGAAAGAGGAGGASYAWTPLRLCNALAAQRRWRGRRGGRLDTYRAANTILRAALAGKMGLTLAFLPPGVAGEGGEGDGGDERDGEAAANST